VVPDGRPRLRLAAVEGLADVDTERARVESPKGVTGNVQMVMPLLRGVMMLEDRKSDGRDHEGSGIESIPSADGRGVRWALPAEPDGRPGLRIRIIERTAIVHFLDSEILFEEAVVQAIGDQLDRLLEEGYTRLLLNFGGVRYLSCALLGRIAELQRKRVDPVRGHIQLCGLDPLLRDVLRITQLDRVFDVCGDEAEALGLILH
jgi:anti-anti-sigma factor